MRGSFGSLLPTLSPLLEPVSQSQKSKLEVLTADYAYSQLANPFALA